MEEEFKIDNKDILEFLVQECPFDKKELIEKLVKYLRHQQKVYVEAEPQVPTEGIAVGNRLISGIELLLNLIEDGAISIRNAINILPSIERYDAPYELNIK